jgi:osmotically-inducible protein OsmY
MVLGRGRENMTKLIRCVTVALGLVLATTPLVAQATRDTSTMVNDAWITTQIYAKFFVDSDIKARNIDVQTVSGVVTLRGTVQNGAERQQAVTKAKSTDGVKQVIDKLTLPQAEKPPAPGDSSEKSRSSTNAEQVKAHARSAADRVGKEISDTWITTKVQAIYFLDKDVKGMQIDVTTKGGVVTLRGTVPTDATRQKAVADARSIEGVTQVVDQLTVKK